MGYTSKLGATMRVLVFLASLLATSLACGQSALPFGVWYGGSDSSMAVFGYFVISESKLTWGRPGNGNFSKDWCHAGYRIVDEKPPATVYSRLPSSNIASVRVELVEQTCEPVLEGLRFSYERKEEGPIYLDFVAYRSDGSEYRSHFFKLDTAEVQKLDTLLRNANESR
jgi:hypothetical protein